MVLHKILANSFAIAFYLLVIEQPLSTPLEACSWSIPNTLLRSGNSIFMLMADLYSAPAAILFFSPPKKYSHCGTSIFRSQEFWSYVAIPFVERQSVGRLKAFFSTVLDDSVQCDLLNQRSCPRSLCTPYCRVTLLGVSAAKECARRSRDLVKKHNAVAGTCALLLSC